MPCPDLASADARFSVRPKACWSILWSAIAWRMLVSAIFSPSVPKFSFATASMPPIEAAPAPMPMPEIMLRSCSSKRLAMVQPLLISPTRFSFGTFTSVRKVSQNGEAPEMSLIGRASTPSLSISMSKKEMPSCLTVESVRTRQKIMSHLSA